MDDHEWLGGWIVSALNPENEEKEDDDDDTNDNDDSLDVADLEEIIGMEVCVCHYLKWIRPHEIIFLFPVSQSLAEVDCRSVGISIILSHVLSCPHTPLHVL